MATVEAELPLEGLLARFDELEEMARDRPAPSSSSSMPPVEVPGGGWPDEQPEFLPPGHFGGEAFGDEDDANAFIEYEESMAFAVAVPGEDGYWYIWYVDNTDELPG